MSTYRLQEAILLVSASALLFLHPSLSRADSILVPTGGNLTGVTPQAMSANYGSFSATRVKSILVAVPPDFQSLRPEDVQTAVVSGSYTPTSLNLAGTPLTVYPDDGSGPLVSSASGDIGFDLTSRASIGFSWSQPPQVGQMKLNLDPFASVELLGPGGSVALGCVGSYGFFNIAGGCVAGAPPPDGTSHGALDQQGVLDLAAGHYDLKFALDSSYFVGTPVGTDFSFGVSVVPLPPALYLLLSGLIGLIGSSRVNTMAGTRPRAAA